MLDDIIPSNLLTGTVGATATLSIAVTLILFGRLIPWRTHQDRVGDKNEQIAYLQKMIDKRDEQLTKLLDQGNLTVMLLDELKRQADIQRAAGVQPSSRARRITTQESS